MREEELETKLEKRNRFIKIFAFFIIFLSSIIIIYDYNFLGKGNSLKGISKIVINGHVKVSKEEILKQLEITDDFSIDKANIRNLEEKLMKHPRMKTVNISKRSKDQLLISILEHQAKYILNINDNLYEINDELKVISTDQIKEENLCILSGDFQFVKSNNKRLKDLVDQSNRLFENYPKLKERISEIHLADDGEITMFTYFPQRIKVFIGNKFESLQNRKIYASLAFFENRSMNLKLLDLRGEDAVYQ